jgi:phage replication-related protein YjqB (UPF0714/DUF867 family)
VAECRGLLNLRIARYRGFESLPLRQWINMGIEDTYPSFHALSVKEEVGMDFSIRYTKGVSSVAILAPHGGGIEPGTTEIAEAIAGKIHSFYTFEGIKIKGNAALHITSTIFDEPIALHLISKSERTITIHGCEDEDPQLIIGGLDDLLAKRVKISMERSAIRATIFQSGYLSGRSKNNICNKNLTGKGLQLELSRGLRRKMFKGLDRSGRSETLPLFRTFVNVIKNELG